MIQFTRFVGDAPGTTTMQMSGLGVCPPGHYGAEIPGVIHAGTAVRTVGPSTEIAVNPYGTESKLDGLRAPSIIRWDLLLLGFGLAFAGVLGFAFFKIHKRRR